MAIVPTPGQLLGQQTLVDHFGSLLNAGQLPHAILLTGEEGGEALPLAFVLARQILCDELGTDGTPCGTCHSCRQMDALQHPDLTLVFPVIKSGDTKSDTSERHLDTFIKMMSNYRRFTMSEWRQLQNAGNKQLQILVAEAERLIHNASLRSFKSHYQVILIWQPETMRVETANKLLKLLEEPPKGVIFIMVSHQPQALLPTIISRLQRVNVPKIPKEALIDYLIREESLAPEIAEEVGHLAQGSLYRALQLKATDGEVENLREALDFLSLPLLRRPKPCLEKAQELAKLDRPEVISLIESLTPMLRELLALKYGDSDTVFIPSSLLSDARKVSGALSLHAYEQAIEEIDSAKLEIRQNGNIQIVIFDLLLTLIKLYSF